MTIKKAPQWVKSEISNPAFGSSTHPDFHGTTRETWDNGTVSSNYYRYTGDSGNDGEPTVSASIGLIHRGGTGSTTYPPKELLTSGESNVGDYTWPPSDLEYWLPAASDTTDVGQINLFKHNSNDASSTVTGLFSTKEGRVPAMTGLGVAVADTVENFGRVPKPSTDLSKHSSKLVQNLQSRGAVDPQAMSIPTNGLSYWDNQLARPRGFNDETISPEKMAQGKRLMKSVTRRPRTQSYEQGTLF